MSESATEYHKAENECASHYYHQRKKKAVSVAVGKAPELPNNEEKQEAAKQQKEDKAKEKSHQR